MIIIVKRSRKSRVLSSQKKQFFSNESSHLYAYITTALFAALVGTYLDLIFVGAGMYHFPVRLFPELFTINIVFTLFFLPLFTVLFLLVAKRVPPFVRAATIIVISAGVFFAEHFAEQLGWFQHGTNWNHVYSLIGYMLFLCLIWKLFLVFSSFRKR
ncbi:CBO0543 family protein [Alteribacillus persepolensis]|uniref:CBO0543 family protein n=1 Tax=Alteribacillus persepolensis TaxID=568899 RepID=UPI000B887805|nr:CBO0543 family protein [Alteribacillus persepolensis]